MSDIKKPIVAGVAAVAGAAICSTARMPTATCRRIDLMQPLAKEARRLMEIGKEEGDEKLINLGSETMYQIIQAL